MKKFFLMLLACGLFITAGNLNSRPQEWWYTAFVHVYDHAGNPKSGIRVRFVVVARDDNTDENLFGEAYGTTNSAGYVEIDVCFDGQCEPVLEWMKAEVAQSGYATIQSSGNYSTSGSSLYPQFWVGTDQDHNGVYDDWELPLAQKFCPNLILDANDQGVRPVPVEILDRNGD